MASVTAEFRQEELEWVLGVLLYTFNVILLLALFFTSKV